MLVLPRLPPMHFFSFHYNFSQNKALLPIGFFVLWVSSEILVDHKSETPVDIHIHLAFTEAIKLFAAFCLYSARQKYFRYDSLDPYQQDNEDQPLSNINIPLESSHESFTLRIRLNELAQIYPRLRLDWPSLNGWRLSLSILVISALYAIRAYVISKSREHTDPLAPYLVIPAASLCSLFVLRVFCRRTYAPQLWYAALLQFCGVFIARSGFISRSSDLPDLSLLASALSISFSDTLVDISPLHTQVYKSHHPSFFDAINLFIFTGQLSCPFIALYFQRNLP
ncbi:hypothetical protein F4604DRAFT_1998874 [Suillus subluteus]|nr:hypothetical protein F4604DRAFT_1998874 [Suillus subluteus]